MALTKTKLLSALAHKTGGTRKDADAFLDALNEIVVAELKSSKEFTLPGLLKIKVSEKAAVPARPGKNPFTGQPTTFKARPARRAVKAAAVKALRDSL